MYCIRAIAFETSVQYRTERYRFVFTFFICLCDMHWRLIIHFFFMWGFGGGSVEHLILYVDEE